MYKIPIIRQIDDLADSLSQHNCRLKELRLNPEQWGEFFVEALKSTSSDAHFTLMKQRFLGGINYNGAKIVRNDNGINA